MDYSDLTTLGIAFGLGLLVGLQRERTDNKMAGIRTFTLIGVLGTVTGFMTRDFDNPFILPTFGIAIAALLVMANVVKLKKFDEADVGQTTEVAALLMFALGAYLVLGNQVIAIIVGGAMAILLYIKDKMHGIIDRLKKKDISAIMTFVGISLIILPILPNETYGPLDVLNPNNIWLMVVLIVGISVTGYFIYKFVGKKAGIVSNGILGGMISSTATTISYARKTSKVKSINKIATFIITVASAISLVRVLVEVGVVIPENLPQIILPLMVEFLVLLIISIVLFYLINKEEKDDTMPEPENPAQFKSALIFGLLYGFILLAVAFTKEEFGNNALYAVAIISGLTDVDAITLSLSQLIKGGGLDTSLGWKLILLATLSNLLFKGVMAAALGTKRLAKLIAVCFGISICSGLLIIWLWPESWHF
ncbi:MgtC/SapB family protein [Flagellimonas crocea]|uniref:MgtC/SapB family protein n=1 Tax=Flagellimonas crocea TaxID=3067311 RepID=UPI00296FEF8A|nr:MgtC/SapB family protein [Muricauda sp. DH64]